MNEKAASLKDSLIVINELLNCAFLSEGTRQQLSDMKTEVENELRSILAQHVDLKIA